jgi:hypothetical protein
MAIRDACIGGAIMSFSKWTDVEKRVWKKLTKTGEYDFNEVIKINLDPEVASKESKDPYTDRTLHSYFLEDIYGNPKLRQQIHRKGVRITGAYIVDGLDLEDAKFDNDFRLLKCRIEGTATLKRASLTRIRDPQFIDFDGSYFTGELCFVGAKIDGTLKLSEVHCGQLNLQGARIGGTLDLTSIHSCVLDLRGIVIDEDLLIEDVHNQDYNIIDATGALVKKNLRIINTDVIAGLTLDAVSVNGNVEITGGKWTGEISIRSTCIDGDITIADIVIARRGRVLKQSDGRVVGCVFVRNIKGPGRIEFKGVTGGKLEIENLRDVLAVSLAEAKFCGQVRIVSSEIKTLDLKQCHIAGSLDIRELKARVINLDHAHVEGMLVIEGNKNCGILILDKAQILQELKISEMKFVSLLSLEHAMIGWDLDISEVECTCPINMGHLEVRRNIKLQEVKFAGILRLHAAKVDGYLSLSAVSYIEIKTGILDLTDIMIGANLKQQRYVFFSEMKLKGAKVDGTLELIPSLQKNLKGARAIDLSNANVGAFIMPLCDIRSMQIGLNGFKYNQIQGFERLEEEERERGVKHVCMDFIKAQNPNQDSKTGNKDQPPDAFLQMASVLRAMGYPTEANLVLFEGMETKRKKAQRAHKIMDSIGHWLSKLLIGYGIGWRYFRVLVPTAILMLAGAFVVSTMNSSNTQHSNCHSSDIQQVSTLSPTALAFSLERLLPFSLNYGKKHEEMLEDFSENASLAQFTYLIIIHKIAGYILISIILAGLSGITRRL